LQQSQNVLIFSAYTDACTSSCKIVVASKRPSICVPDTSKKERVMTHTDLMDAYVHVRVSVIPMERKMLYLPFVLTTAPGIFIKLIKAIAAELQKRDI